MTSPQFRLPAPPPAQMLAEHVVLTMSQAAWVLGLLCQKGESRGLPDPRRARALVRDGSIAVVDQSQPTTRWVVAADEIRRYLIEGPRHTRLIAVPRRAS